LLAGLQGEHRVVVVVAVGDQYAGAGQRSQIECLLGEDRVDDPLTLLVKASRDGLVLLDHHRRQAERAQRDRHQPDAGEQDEQIESDFVHVPPVRRE
jgi:hypothetical protein